ncbi:MAG: acyltransferase [Patescibacteria group bacterium]|jgi:surface polysaccharide O-acyltransferase-like enzyme
MKKNWIKEIDYLRAVAILAVILIHATDPWDSITPLTSVGIIALTLNELSIFGVSFFFVISGMVLFRSMQKKDAIIPFYLRRIQSILIPYLFFTIIYEIFKKFYLGIPLSQATVFHDLYTGQGYFHFWFLVVLFYYYLIYPFLYRIFIKFKQLNPFLNGIVFIVFLVLPFLWQITSSKFGLAKIDGQVRITEFFRYLPFLYGGIAISANYERIKQNLHLTKTLILASVSLVAIFTLIFSIYLAVNHPGIFVHIQGIYHYYSLIFLPFYVFPLFFILIKFFSSVNINQSVLNLLKKIGDYSLGIYLIHIMYNILIFGELIYKYLNLTWNNILAYILLFIGSSLASILTIWIISKIPYSGWILGNRVRNAKTI